MTTVLCIMIPVGIVIYLLGCFTLWIDKQDFEENIIEEIRSTPRVTVEQQATTIEKLTNEIASLRKQLKEKEIARSIKTAKEMGLYDQAEHLTSSRK